MAKGKHRRSFRDERVSQCWCSTEMSTRIPSVSDGSGDNMISADKHVRFYKNHCYLIAGAKISLFCLTDSALGLWMFWVNEY